MNLDDIFISPDHYPLAFEASEVGFVQMDRAAYQRSIFLDPPRIQPHRPELARASLEAVHTALPGARPGKVSYIFHVAHCGSTLLARALDLAEETLVLREPTTLRQLGVAAARMAGAASKDWDKRAQVVAALLARRYRADAPVIVKANVPVNFMLLRLNEIAPFGPSVVLYYSLENYLTAILRTPNHQVWAQGVSQELAPAIAALTGRAGSADIAETAALLWLAQMRAYHALIVGAPQTASLDAEDLFGRPEDVLRAAFAHVGKPQPDAVVSAIVAGDLFRRYSKNPGLEFDNTARLERARHVRAQLSLELKRARALIEKLPAAQALPSHLSNDLLGGATPLLGAP